MSPMLVCSKVLRCLTPTARLNPAGNRLYTNEYIIFFFILFQKKYWKFLFILCFVVKKVKNVLIRAFGYYYIMD